MTNAGAYFAVVFCYVATLRGTVACEPGDRLPDDASAGDIDRLVKAGAVRFQPTPVIPVASVAPVAEQQPDVAADEDSPGETEKPRKRTTRRAAHPKE